MMTDPAVKTAMGLCVLLAGVCAALLLRRDASRPAPSDPPAAERLLIRRCVDIPTAADASQRPAVVVTPLDRQQSPPPLTPDYPETQRVKTNVASLPQWPSGRFTQTGPVPLPPVSPSQTTRSHKIVDGDTLAALAERYLGSAWRAAEIFEANRNVLSDPRLLPIGVELKIPPRRRRSAPAWGPSSDVLPRRPLAPVPRSSKGSGFGTRVQGSGFRVQILDRRSIKPNP